MKALNDVHDKLCNGDVVYREPSEELLSEEEYPISVIEFEQMYDLMMKVSNYKENIQQNQEVYDMLQDVMSCMRDTGMIDSYLFLMFTKGSKAHRIASIFTITIIDSIIEDDHKSRNGKLFFIEDRLDNIMNVMSLRDPDHVEEDNERYGDMDEMLSRMKVIVKNVKVKFDQIDEEKKTAAKIDQNAIGEISED